VPAALPHPDQALGLNRYAQRLHFYLFGHRELQHAVAARGLGARGVDGFGQDEAAVKAPMTALDSLP
jgi:hypothetical protein